ncbi:MAG: hypothetical protein WBM50_03925 [Acidimicrobiales bacterium]
MIRAWPPLLRARLVPTLLAVAFVSAACGELVPPEAYSPTTSTTAADGAQTETPSPVNSQPEPVAGLEGFVPTPEPGYVPTLLVSGDRFVFAVDGQQSIPLAGALADLDTIRVVDDLGGGLVTQAAGGPIVYRQAQGEPEVLDDSGARLLDVGYWDGSPRAFVEVGSGRVDWIQLAERTGTGRERQTHLELADDEEIVAFSASRDIQAAIVQDDRCGQLRFYNSDGQPLAFPGPPQPECVFPGRPVYGAVALSPDGDAVVYTIVSYRGDGTEEATELVARELRVGSELFFGRRIGENLDVVSSLAFDGERAAYLKQSQGSDSVTVLNLTVDSLEVPVDLLDAGIIHSVSFARIPVAPVG